GAFNVVLLEHAEAIVPGAERAELPVVLQISQNCVTYHGGFEPIAVATMALARRARVPALVHLDHAQDIALVHEAVAVGTSYAMTQRTAAIDVELIRALACAVDVPLVLHGSSGLADDELRRAVAAGITKVNISTHLNVLFTGAVRGVLGADPPPVDPRRYISAGRAAVAAEVARLLTLLAGS
ncbi:MAG: class II fructose-bisphosphate aldolase, partial [Micrococcales bacterium]|nr:class II fructose-bisphosphate aldolase [Micrococcales bacterium]